MRTARVYPAGRRADCGASWPPLKSTSSTRWRRARPALTSAGDPEDGVRHPHRRVETLTGFTALDDDCPGSLPQRDRAWPWTTPTSRSARTTSSAEHRDPTITEIRLIDTYWSDHCRHTTFGTILDEVEIDDELVQGGLRRATWRCARRFTRPRQEEARHPDGSARPSARKALKKRGHAEGPGREPRRSTPAPSRSTCDVDGRDSRTGCSCSRTRPTTTPPKSSPSAARPPASAVPSATRCPAAAMFTRPCASPARPTR